MRTVSLLSSSILSVITTFYLHQTVRTVIRIIFLIYITGYLLFLIMLIKQIRKIEVLTLQIAMTLNILGITDQFDQLMRSFGMSEIVITHHIRETYQ